MRYDDARIAIYFGDAQDQIYPAQYLREHRNDFMNHPSVQQCVEGFSLQQLFFLSQIHGVQGMVVRNTQHASLVPFSLEGDFLVTDVPGLGIGVMTADCLPVVCYDKKQHVAAIAHAGWRGAVAGIMNTMIAMMQNRYENEIADLQFFFGPSAQVCCYEVNESFVVQLDLRQQQDAVVERSGVLFFDLPYFVSQQVQTLGVCASQINFSYAFCTICDYRFCSHRRATKAGTAAQEGRQMTVIVLKDCCD